MMILYEESELFGILLKTCAIVFFSGIMILSFVPVRTIFPGTPRQDLKSGPVEVSLIMLLPQYIIILIIFIGTILNSWH